MELARQMGPAAGRPGLRSEEARRLLAVVGANTLGTERRAAWWRTLLGVVREPMIFLLIACAAVYVVFGDLTEALILGITVVVVVTISLVQVGRTERALQVLKDLSSPVASVRRDGRAGQRFRCGPGRSASSPRG